MTKEIPDMLAPTPDAGWSLTAHRRGHIHEACVESRFAVSNGFLGVRGGRAVVRSARWIMPPQTYIAGLFDTPLERDSGPELIPAASWLGVRISLPFKILTQRPFSRPAYHMTLDMRHGTVMTDWKHSQGGSISGHLRSLRMVSMSERAIGLQVVELAIDEGETEISLEAGYDALDLGLILTKVEEGLVEWRTQVSGKRLALATAAELQVDGQLLTPEPADMINYRWSWLAKPGQVARLKRMVAFVRSDESGPDPEPIARAKLAKAQQIGWRGVLNAHEQAWEDRWEASDVAIEGDDGAKEALRFAVYHLNSAANPEDETVSIGARALTGDDYHGHVFWDTEIYLLPFYSWTWPQAARAALMYRFHTLGGARQKAKHLGWRGALYAWESTDTGVETTPEQVIGPDRQVVPVLSGLQEHHISADVAYAVWNYWLITGDDAFFRDAGAEILFETARFWASRTVIESDGRGHIRTVIGPDEYHEGVDDNAFTNVMARWNIRRALETVEIMRERWPETWDKLAAKLKLDGHELDAWRRAADVIVDGLDEKTGIFEQFEGFFGLEYVDLKQYCGRTVPMDVVLGRERTQNSQVVKQADVVALIGLLPEEFPGDRAKKNFDYYEARTGHGSSLSASMHGLVAARLGESEKALRYLRQSAAPDLSDDAVSSGGGVHIAALGGNWMIPVLGFASLRCRSDGVSLDPKLPPTWQSLTFAVEWRGRPLKIRIDNEAKSIEASLERGEPMTLALRGEAHTLEAGKPLRLDLGDEALTS